MPNNPRLNFNDFNNTTMARIGNGHRCVLFMIENLDYSRSGRDFIILRPDDAAALGRALIKQAERAREGDHFEGCSCPEGAE